jgi:hypothetical protein
VSRGCFSSLPQYNSKWLTLIQPESFLFSKVVFHSVCIFESFVMADTTTRLRVVLWKTDWKEENTFSMNFG